MKNKDDQKREILPKLCSQKRWLIKGIMAIDNKIPINGMMLNKGKLTSLVFEVAVNNNEGEIDVIVNINFL